MMKQYGLINTIQLNKRYRLIRILGQGGFGVTYIAEDETLGQKVVIKEYFPVGLVKRTESHEIVLKNTESDKKLYEEGMRRFLNEAQVLASLFEIPGVVKVLDYFQENGTAYIVMEYIKGISLRSYLERTSEEISFQKAWDMLLPVMNALEMIHGKGLLHRDLNPDNLMVEEDGTVKMLDFGSAREYFLEHDREKTMTILVKNGYAPPEQYEAKGKQGPWTDVYALSATLYEMMTGYMPPGSKERQVSDELFPPSTFAIDITPEQEDLLLNRGMALGVSERFQSVLEMKQAFFPESAAKNRSQNKIKTSWIVLGIVLVSIIGILTGMSRHIFSEYKEEIVYAGNFRRDSKEYKEFMDYVKENAIQTETLDMDNSAAEGETYTKYILDEDAVKEIGIPGNSHRLKLKESEVVKAVESCGYVLEEMGTKQNFVVFEEPYGAIRADFEVYTEYKVQEGIYLMITYDYFDHNIYSMRIRHEKGVYTDYVPFMLEMFHALYPDFGQGDITEEKVHEHMALYREDYEAGKGPIRGYESNGMGILFYMSEDLGDDMIITVRSNRALTLMTISPPYNW